MSQKSESGKNTIHETEIRSALDGALRSPEFRRAPQLSKFLEYIVEMTLDGRADEIKGYTIGLEVFGKPETFDPEQDASVRVDAGRLRKALASYYAGEGSDSPVRITVPQGKYVPVFERNASAAMSSSDRAVKRVRGTSKAGLVAATLALVCAGAVIGLLGEYLFHPAHDHSHDSVDVTASVGEWPEEALQRPTGPLVAVLPFMAIGNSDTEQHAYGFTQSLVTDLTRFRSLRLLGMDTVRNYTELSSKSREVAGWLNADYAVEGTLQRSGDLTRVQVRLLDVKAGNYIWSHSVERELQQENFLQIQTEIVGAIAARLGQPYGVVQRIEARRLKENVLPTYAAYKCVLEFYAYARRKSASIHLQVRDCLEEAVKDRPDYAEAWALLSWIYGDEVRYGFNPRGSLKDSVNRSHKAADMAIRIAPSNANTHQYAAVAAQLRNDKNEALRQIGLALKLNPNDADILADAGWVNAQQGNWELAKSFVEKAIWLNPGHPRWYFGVLFAYHYDKRDYESALKYALLANCKHDVFSGLALAASYGMLDLGHEADAAVINLIEKFPGLIQSSMRPLQGWTFRKSFIDHLLEGVAKAGLNLAPSG